MPPDATDSARDAARRRSIGILNARLPRKRVIAQGLLRNERGEVLLCELTYKKEWDLPGGVVDPGESPADCVVREIAEELDAEVTVEGLVGVNWLPPWRGWDDAVLLVFDLGEVASEFTNDLTLLRKELKAVHWVAPDSIAAHVAPYTARMMEQIARGDHAAYGRYWENSESLRRAQ